MQGDDPPYLPVGTAVSAKYKGAFCEAKVSKVVRCVKCKITYKLGLGTATVTDEQIRGPLRVGHIVQARHSEKKEFIEATITKIQDCSQYTVVFDDGDITTLRRTALCLKSGRHFNESETLDQLPLTHPEHFGNPVVGGRRGRRSRQLKEDSSEGEPEEETEPDLDVYSSDIGKVVCVEGNDKKKSRENWFPGLVVVPSAQPTVRINVREEYLVRSFKDGRYYTVPKKEISDFTRDMGARVESTALSEAMEKALKYLDRDELPVHWERGSLFDLQLPDSDSDENYTDSSDDEPREEKDHFVAQLYKFMDDRGTPLNKSPMIASRDVDLYRLFRVVQKLGGYNRVTNQGKWRSVTIRLGYPHNHATYNQVKQAYKKHLFSFEEFYRKLGCTMINHPRNAKKHRGRSLIRDRDRATPVSHSPRPEDCPLDDLKFVEAVSVVTPTKNNKEAPKMKEDDIKEVKKVKKEVSVERSSSSSSSSDATIDLEAGPSKTQTKPEEPLVVVVVAAPATATTTTTTTKKKLETPKVAKERKVKGALGDKVKVLVEQFEEAHKVIDEEKVLQQQTRSKSAIPRLPKEVASPERKEAPPPAVAAAPTPAAAVTATATTTTAPGARLVKLPKKLEEDKSKRGRKRKDTETETKPPSEPAVEASPSTSQPVNIGDKLKVYYGPTHESKVTYEAKVLEIDRDSAGTIYLVHYTGWNTRYDEWIKAMRIAENLSLTTKAKRLKQGHTPNKTTKNAAKRGRGTSITSRDTLPPRSTTPSSVTSSSSRTKSPATPASNKTSRVTRQGETSRRTRRTSAHTDLSVASSDSDPSESESEELSRTRSGSKSDDQPLLRKKLPPKRKEVKDDEDSDDEVQIKPKRMKKKIKVKPDEKNSTESDDDEASPPKGRDFDLNQIRSELKGFEKAVKLSTEATPLELPDDKIVEVPKVTPKPEVLKIDKDIELTSTTTTTDDIYEFKEPEPFEFEARTKTEDKPKKRLVPRLFEELEKSPKKKGGKTPPKTDADDKKSKFKRTPKKVEDDEEETPVKVATTSADPFDKLVESPSFNIGGEKRTPPPAPPPEVLPKARVVKALNMDETLSLFGELPETVGDDSRDRLDLSDTDDTQTEPLFTHKEPIFSDPSFSKVESDPIFRGFSGEDDKKCSKEQSDEDDSITAAIQRAISNTMTDEDSTEDDLFQNHFTPKTAIKEKPIVLASPPKAVPIIEAIKEPLTINTAETKDVKDYKEKAKLISPALQETDSSLLEAICLKTEVLKKDELREPQIKTGTKIADSILQKFNMIKKNEEIKPVIVAQVVLEPKPIVEEIKIEVKVEPVIVEAPPEAAAEPPAVEFIPEIKKRSKKVVSREFIEESDTDSDDSEERLVIARSDEDSQTSPSDKLDSKDIDSNSAPAHVTTDDSQPEERNFKLEEIKIESPPSADIIEPKTEIIVKPPEEEPDNNISLLLCKETIPGSPAPVTEASPAPAEPRTKPKSAKSLLLEMPFASAPGSSNSKTMMPVEAAAKVSIKEEVVPLAMPLEVARGDCPDASNAVIDNTPPTTPESTISNLSPRGDGDRDRISPSAVDNESCKSTDSGALPSKVTHYSEEDTILTAEAPVVPKKPSPPSTSRIDELSGAALCRKRRRSCKASDEMPAKRGRRPNVRNLRTNSDSDTSEHSVPGSTPPTISITTHVTGLQIETRRLSSRSPRPSKYNFIIELDPGLECSQKISLLQQKLIELRKTYNNVKTELACIDRRRKKLRRREREAMKAAKQELACA